MDYREECYQSRNPSKNRYDPHFQLQDKLEEEMRKTDLKYFHKALLEVVMCEESQSLLPIPNLLTTTFTSKLQPQLGVSITTWPEELCSCYQSA